MRPLKLLFYGLTVTGILGGVTTLAIRGCKFNTIAKAYKEAEKTANEEMRKHGCISESTQARLNELYDRLEDFR